jgi:hypothetical protein
MKLLCGIVLLIALLTAGCGVSKANEHAPNPDGFDQALSDFQQHLTECPYPAAHIMVFARSWNIPEFVVQAYVPKDVVMEKGKTE